MHKVNIFKEMVHMLNEDMNDKDMCKIFINFTQKQDLVYSVE